MWTELSLTPLKCGKLKPVLSPARIWTVASKGSSIISEIQTDRNATLNHLFIHVNKSQSFQVPLVTLGWFLTGSWGFLFLTAPFSCPLSGIVLRFCLFNLIFLVIFLCMSSCYHGNHLRSSVQTSQIPDFPKGFLNVLNMTMRWNLFRGFWVLEVQQREI